MKNTLNLIVAILMLTLWATISPVFAQNVIPPKVLATIGDHPNKAEFLKVLANYSQPSDSLKFKAACFLIANMRIHQSESYYWADSLNKKIAFDELAYGEFSSAINAFNGLKSKYGKLHPVPTQTNDMDDFHANRLISDIDAAFKYWSPTFCDFNTFCEYVLPYRISVEPLFDWRDKFHERFSKLFDPKANISENIRYLVGNINLWFTCTYNLEKRDEPLPRLSSLQLLQRKKGTCEDAADLVVFTLRSLGVPVTVDIVPYWATSTGGHALNCAFDPNNQPIHFDALSQSDSLHDFVREPGKVFRTTYSIQSDALANRLRQEEIPPYALLRQCNYKDVTQEYWPVRNVACALNGQSQAGKIVYACVYNGGSWKPVWWGESTKDSVTFNNMSKGAVYLPKYYENGKLIAAGDPVASGNGQVIELKPDTVSTRAIRLTELPGYLKFRAGAKYKLAYYDHKWNTIGIKKAGANTKELIFTNVPRNALLILMPNYGEKKERPFIITDAGERIWW